MSVEVPLGEEREEYLLRVRVGEAVVRDVQVAMPQWTYSYAQQLADGATGGCVVEVSQISAQFGPGATARYLVEA
jgi:hypothetical protein